MNYRLSRETYQANPFDILISWDAEAQGWRVWESRSPGDVFDTLTHTALGERLYVYSQVGAHVTFEPTEEERATFR